MILNKLEVTQLTESNRGRFTYRAHRTVLTEENTHLYNRATEFDWDVFPPHPISDDKAFYQSILKLITNKVPENIFPDDYTFTKRTLNRAVFGGRVLEVRRFDAEQIIDSPIFVNKSMKQYYNQAFLGSVEPKTLTFYIPVRTWFQHEDTIFCNSIYDHYLLLGF